MEAQLLCCPRLRLGYCMHFKGSENSPQRKSKKRNRINSTILLIRLVLFFKLDEAKIFFCEEQAKLAARRPPQT